MSNDFITPERLTITGMLATAIVTGARKVWVWGYQIVEAEKRKADSDAAYEVRLKEVQGRAQRWETIALRALNVGEKVIQSKTNGEHGTD